MLLTVKELVKEIKVSERVIRTMMVDGCPYYRTGGKKNNIARLDLQEVLNWMKTNAEKYERGK